MTTASEPTLIPYILVKDAVRAIDFYTRVFGAEESGARFTDPNGKIGHAELRIGNSKIMLADEHPEQGHVFSPIMFYMGVDDVDDAVGRAVDAGATLTRPVKHEAYGHKSGVVRDPFGHSWMVSTQVEEVSKEELQQRVGAEYRIS
jgi:PhnB protein